MLNTFHYFQPPLSFCLTLFTFYYETCSTYCTHLFCPPGSLLPSHTLFEISGLIRAIHVDVKALYALPVTSFFPSRALSSETHVQFGY